MIPRTYNDQTFEVSDSRRYFSPSKNRECYRILDCSGRDWTHHHLKLIYNLSMIINYVLKSFVSKDVRDLFCYILEKQSHTYCYDNFVQIIIKVVMHEENFDNGQSFSEIYHQPSRPTSKSRDKIVTPCLSIHCFFRSMSISFNELTCCCLTQSNVNCEYRKK